MSKNKIVIKKIHGEPSARNLLTCLHQYVYKLSSLLMTSRSFSKVKWSKANCNYQFQMPLNGKAAPVAKPSWLKDSTATPATTPARPSWARKTPEAKKEDSPVEEKKVVTKKIVSKEPEAPKKEVTSRLQSREIKVPFKVEKTVPTQSILKKPDVKIKQDLKEEKTTLPLRDTKTPSKSPSKTPTSTASKSPSTTPSKSTSTTPSKSPSKTPDYDSDDSDESSYETETDTDETESDDDDFSEGDKPSYKPPAGANRKGSAASIKPEPEPEPDYSFKKPALKKVITRQKSDAKERSTSPEPKFLKPNLRKVPSSLKIKEPPPREKLPVVDLKKIPAKAEPEMKLQRKNSEVFPHKPSILRDQSNKKSEWKVMKVTTLHHHFIAQWRWEYKKQANIGDFN